MQRKKNQNYVLNLIFIVFFIMCFIGLAGAKVGIDAKFYVYIGTVILFFYLFLQSFQIKKR